MTLLTETIEFLSGNGKNPADVRWVGVLHPHWMFTINPDKVAEPVPVGTWDDFARFANFEYNSDFGCNEVAATLVIVGDNWWLERGEYDGSEWWQFKMLPTRPDAKTPLCEDDLKEL